MGSQKCEFCEKSYLEMWILWKMRLSKCEFCQKWDFENVIIFGKIEDFCSSLKKYFYLLDDVGTVDIRKIR